MHINRAAFPFIGKTPNLIQYLFTGQNDFPVGHQIFEQFILFVSQIADRNSCLLYTSTYKDLPRQVKEGQRILIDDGNVEMKVLSCTDTDILCKVTDGGKISNHKGINVPNTSLDMPYLSDADKADLIFGIEQDVDFIAASFVRCKEDVIEMRKFIDRCV